MQVYSFFICLLFFMIAKNIFTSFLLIMNILPINFNYKKNTQFCGNKGYSTEKWLSIRDVLTKSDNFWFNSKTETKIFNIMPIFNKAHFEYSDYQKLSLKEKLIISLLNKKGANLEDSFTGRKDISINKDAERILEFASKTKEYFDDKYKNGYKLVGIGNSPAAIVETMQLLGADAITIPFSRVLIDQSHSREFPYEHWVPDEDSSDYFPDLILGHWEELSAKDWEEYFKFYGIEKDFSKKTGKALIFTDYICDGWTIKYIESILNGLGFENNYEFIDTLMLLPRDIKLQMDYSLFRCLDGSEFKDYAKMESPKVCYRNIDIIRHPEYIPSLPEPLKSKLFRCALYDLLAEKENKNILNFSW